jgi:hypothetical protein
VKDRIFKVLPIVVGLLLGWLLVNPPAVLQPLGLFRHVVTAGLVVLLMLLFSGTQIAASLPENVTLQRIGDGAVARELAVLRDEMADLGFVPVGPPYKVGVSPAATMIALVHREEPIYAAAFQTGTIPAKVAYDFVSILEGDRGGLTSNANPAGAMLPASPGSLRQVFTDMPLAHVFDGHRSALEYLAGRGLRARTVSAAAFPRDFQASMRRQRRAFLSAPLRRTAITLWRVATKSTPHIGPIQTQAAAQAEIESLLAGRSARRA